MPIMASLAELIASSANYADNYSWFVDLARNFHTIQESAFSPLRTFFHFTGKSKRSSLFSYYSNSSIKADTPPLLPDVV
jgi:hypothetical protein